MTNPLGYYLTRLTDRSDYESEHNTEKSLTNDPLPDELGRYGAG